MRPVVLVTVSQETGRAPWQELGAQRTVKVLEEISGNA
jgi:hypothetical protein